jgi:hypothetical protein
VWQHVKAALTCDGWFRADEHRNIEAVADVYSMKARWGYTEHRKRVAFQFECLTDRTGLSPKFALPKPITNHCGRRATTRAIIRPMKYLPEYWLDPEHVEKFPTDP